MRRVSVDWGKGWRRGAWVPVDEGARRLGVSPSYLRDLLLAGRVRGAHKLGEGRRGVWMIPLGLDGRPKVLRLEKMGRR